MVNRQEKFTTNQPDLFQQLEEAESAWLADNAPDLYIRDELRGAMAYALREARKYGLSRQRVVERMNLCLPEEALVSERQLNGWLASSAEDRPMPAEYLPALVWAVRGIVSPVEVLTRALGLHLIDEHEHIAAELGKTLVEEQRARQRKRTLQIRLGGQS
ncbi:MAG TPA: hypothetical protein ENJ17_01120 [Gammaproteobacteria bacterium]|nr:hypothetical protein [Gammaproteobacteria bacterium]